MVQTAATYVWSIDLEVVTDTYLCNGGQPVQRNLIMQLYFQLVIIQFVW
jgi:hypothetical protein